MSNIIQYILSRLNEPSTWRGIVWIATALGLALDPTQKEAIVTAGMAIAGVVGVFTKEKPKPTPDQIEKVKELIQQNVDAAIIKSNETKNENPTPDNFFNDDDGDGDGD